MRTGDTRFAGSTTTPLANQPGVVVQRRRPGRKLLALALVVVAAATAWSGYQHFMAGERTKYTPAGAHYRAAFSSRPIAATYTQHVLGIPITQVSASAGSKVTETILEDTLPPTFPDDATHANALKLVQATTLGTLGVVKSSKTRVLHGHSARQEVRQIGTAEVSLLFLADGPRVYVIDVSATTSTKDAFERLVNSFEITP
jgi:hypothetical protein